MRSILISILVVLIFQPGILMAQDKKTFRTNFIEAEYFFLNEEYKEAAFLYREMINANPDNYNLHFFLGASYLSINGSKTRAIPHLEKAVTSISAGYREGSYRETNAPREALFALARAYHINLQFNESIEFYEKYKQVMRLSDVAELEYVNKQLASVRLAKKYIRDTLDIDFIVLFGEFDANTPNYRAVIAEKDSIIVFMTEKPFYSAIMMSRMKNGRWTEPVQINDQLMVDGIYNLCSITYDGTELYLSVYKDYNWDLYVSYFEDGKWIPIQPLDNEINTKYNETHASLSRDKRLMYFTSDRPGGLGAKDIYSVERDQAGSWGKPVNLGKPVNSIYSEETPFITADGQTLYFSSMSHATMGGFDVFYSNRLPTRNWSYPANLGYPINTCDDDLFFVPLGNGNTALYTSEGGLLPQRKIMAINLEPAKEDLIYTFSGKIITEDRLGLDSTAVITIIDTDSEMTITEAGSVSETGEFQVDIPTGNYKLTVQAEGYEPESEFISLLPQHNTGNIEVETSLTPSRVTSGEYALSRSVLFGFDSHILAETAKLELEKLYILMSENPNLLVEVTGYTDALGPSEYNLKLAHMRSQEVVRYLVSKGIPRESFITKAAGNTGFIAQNIRDDGSDNPEGRKYNRRVEINLVNNSTENIVLKDILVPEHLKPKADKIYFVILDDIEGAQKEIPSRISNRDIKLFETGRKYIYAAGSFNSRFEAALFLNEVIDSDFPESRIISEADFNYLLQPSVPDLSEVKGPFTIQLMAMKTLVKMEFFNESYQVSQIEGKDGIYRYITGISKNYENAQEELVKYVKAGFTDAFINQLSRYSVHSQGDSILSDVDFYYTIQFSALTRPAKPDQFRNIENIVLSRGKDGFHRYSTGIFLNKIEAEKHLMIIKDQGFTDAFIRLVTVGK